MKYFKKTMTFFLIFAVLIPFLVLQTNAYVETGKCGKNLTWTYYSDICTLVVSGKGDMISSSGDDIVTPWYGYRSIKTLIIEEGVTSIGGASFYLCHQLVDVYLPKSLKEIGTNAFAECYKLENVYIPDLETWCNIELMDNSSNILGMASNVYLNGEPIEKDVKIPYGVKKLRNFAFWNCKFIESVTIPESVNSIGWSTFANCDNLVSVKIPGSVEFLDWHAFSGCDNLEEVIISDGVKTISDQAFQNCVKIKTLDIPDSVTRLGTYAFSNCTDLESVTIGKGITEISDNCFSDCINLSDVTISDNVLSIGNGSFGNCTSLKSLTIGENVKVIGDRAFSGCDNLTIRCYEDSVAHQFAKKKKIPFEILCKHIFNNYIVKKEISCTEDGIKIAVCDNGCGESDIIIEKAFGHSFNIYETDDNNLTKTSQCDNCNAIHTIPANAILFNDVKYSDWYAEGVYYCSSENYILGVGNNTFKPSGILTREQFVVILARVAGADLEQYTDTVFVDVKMDSWYGPSIGWAYENGYVNGVGNNRFGVGQNISREGLVTLFYRFAEKNGVDVSDRFDMSGYEDQANISSWAHEACAWAVNVKLLSSTNANVLVLSPKMTVTRAQVAKIFMSYDQIK